MKKTKKVLSLRAETLRALTEERLYEVRGGLINGDQCTAGASGCSTVQVKKCSYAL